MALKVVRSVLNHHKDEWSYAFCFKAHKHTMQQPGLRNISSKVHGTFSIPRAFEIATRNQCTPSPICQKMIFLKSYSISPSAEICLLLNQWFIIAPTDPESMTRCSDESRSASWQRWYSSRKLKLFDPVAMPIHLTHEYPARSNNNHYKGAEIFVDNLFLHGGALNI